MHSARQKLCWLMLGFTVATMCHIACAMAAADTVMTVPAAGGANASIVFSLDANGLLNKIVYGSGSSLPMGGVVLNTKPWQNVSSICSLTPQLRCDPNLPMLNVQGEPNPMAYIIGEAGVSDGQRLFPWADVAKASRFFGLIRQSATMNGPALNIACEAQFLGTVPRNLPQCKSTFDVICMSRQGVQQVVKDNAAMNVTIDNVITICRSLGYR